MADTEKGPLALREEAILKFWEKEKIFEKSLAKPSPKGEFIFYDGPPFATGLPHFGHLLPSTIKDAIPRYRTMQGYRVPRRWGWDCHGLPIENLIEQELGFKTKRDIEQYGIEKFNLAARKAVLRYAEDWKRIIPRLGRWVDMEHDYRTMDAGYTESVWWAFKNLHEKGLVYEGFKAMQLCPRCGTTLSNFEVAQGYKDIDDIAVTVKLPLVDEPDTSLLIWTTTPWTLPGNAAAAVKSDAVYVKVNVGKENFILAKERNTIEGDILDEFLGKTLVGKKYEPPFNYFKDDLHKHKTHAFKVYAADFVTLDSGTGIVHMAPAFGADDLALAQKEKIPLIHHVTDEGKFIATVADFAHLPVKPKGNPRETDQKIAAHLKEKGLLFAEEKINHSYPHCWRCDTPLLNWAANSWFVKVQGIKNKLVAQNAKVSWVPEHVGTGRFRNLLEGAPDWAISRTRFWGAPLPVWRHSKTKEIKVVGSVDELLSMVRKSGNKYFVMRHGEAQSNLAGIFETAGDPGNTLTPEGKRAAEASARQLLNEANIDLIIASPLARTQETARIVHKTLGLPESALMTDERLHEIKMGTYNGKRVADWKKEFPTHLERFERAPPGGETYNDIRKRAGELLFEVENRYTGKNVLFVTHEATGWLLDSVANRKTKHTIADEDDGSPFLVPGTYSAFEFTPYPHNEDYELDVHRPYIDEVPLGSSMEGAWQRVPDVFDCWFESGSMPYASNEYPRAHLDAFNPKRLFGMWPKGYPANFISESIDQTRGWFYSLIVLGVALFGEGPYRHVITNGTVLASDGRKMSKRLKNYPEILEVVDRTGADAMRYFLLSSPVIRGEDVSFSVQGVEEVVKKVLMRLDNVRSFYDLYKDGGVRSTASPHVLDRWILSRLNDLVTQTTAGFEQYELDLATRPLGAFIDDLSTWYLRRSRERLKNEGSDKVAALATLRHALYTLAHLMAPVTPFFAEDLFLRVRQEGDAQSVHLSSWPAAGTVDAQLLSDMKRVREIASLGLQEREKAGIKIRQPLATLSVKVLPPDESLKSIVADEVNVKEVVGDMLINSEVVLDTALTPELREEGMVRDIVRKIQEWRKEQKMNIADRPEYTLAASAEEKAVAEKYHAEIVTQAGLAKLHVELKDTNA